MEKKTVIKVLGITVELFNAQVSLKKNISDKTVNIFILFLKVINFTILVSFFFQVLQLHFTKIIQP